MPGVRATPPPLYSYDCSRGRMDAGPGFGDDGGDDTASPVGRSLPRAFARTSVRELAVDAYIGPMVRVTLGKPIGRHGSVSSTDGTARLGVAGAAAVRHDATAGPGRG
jgi:hypothetical protein